MKRVTKAVFSSGRPLRGLNPPSGLACAEHDWVVHTGESCKPEAV